jgi:CheY-like chemotaxis protein
VIVTGWAMPSVREKSRHLGCASVLVKPCLPDVLTQEIRRVLEKERDGQPGVS